MLSPRRWWSAWRRRRRPVVSSDEGYRIWAATYGSTPNALQRLEQEALARLTPSLAGLAVLDLGCGTGRTSRLAVERGAARVVAVDRSRPMLAAADRRGLPAVTWAAASAEALPFAAASFDVVVSGLMMGHVEILDAALDEAARVLRPGGLVLLTDFHPDASRRGWQRTVTDPATGREVAIEHHTHVLHDYTRGFERRGFAIEALEEPRYDGVPVVLALRARRRAPDRP